MLSNFYLIPREILETICEYLLLPDLGSFLRVNKFIDSVLKEYRKIHPAHIQFNLQKGYFNKLELFSENSYYSFPYNWNTTIVQNEIILAATPRTITVWSRNGSKPLWDKRLDNVHIFREKIWIYNKNIVYAAGNDEKEKMIQVLDLQTGEIKSTLLELQLQLLSVALVQNQVIAKCNNGFVNCWDLPSFNLLKNTKPRFVIITLVIILQILVI